MNKILYGAFAVSLMGMALVGCSSDSSSSSDDSQLGFQDTGSGVDNGKLEEGSFEFEIDSVALNAVGLWRKFADQGVPAYFDSVVNFNGGESPIDTAIRFDGKCHSPALSMDDGTIFLDEMESLYKEGHLVKGVCGKALSLKSGQVAPLGMNLLDSMKVGTVEFWFRPGKDFYDESARTLLGNDESRVHFFVKDGNLIFQKNHADQHFYVQGNAKLKDDWNKIAGQWGDGYMSLWLNDKLVARMTHSMGYAPSLRDIPFGNLLVIGFKTGCCMEPTGQRSSMTTSGDFDQVRVSKVLRYQYEGIEPESSSSEEDVPDSEPQSSNSADIEPDFDEIEFVD